MSLGGFFFSYPYHLHAPTTHPLTRPYPPPPTRARARARAGNRYLEPFAEDLWREPISACLGPAEAARVASRTEEHYFGGLYQKVVFTLNGTDATLTSAAAE